MRLLLLLSLAASPAAADERILDFASELTVNPDGSLGVVETITVRAEGREIRRGIYRDLPLRYHTRYGAKYSLGFQFIGATRDGRAEANHIKDHGAGVRIYLGNKDRLLRAGTYTYRLEYRLTSAVRFFDDHDELYWNVTGDAWAFPIDAAGARVVLPGKARPREGLSVYTGTYGQNTGHARVKTTAEGVAEFHTTAALPPENGMTISVPFDKGIVAEPTPAQRRAAFLDQNRALLRGAVVVALITVYYLVFWFLYGRDPAPGRVSAMPDAAHELTPAAVRYIREMGYDSKTLTAAILGLAVKGALKIDESSSTKVLIRTPRPSETLAQGEAALVREFFNGNDKLFLRRSSAERIRAGTRALEKALAVQYEKSHFVTNFGIFGGGAALSFAGMLWTLAGAGAEAVMIGMFMSVWLSVWTFGTLSLLTQVAGLWKKALLETDPLAVGGALFLSLFSLPFIAGWFFGAGTLLYAAGPHAGSALVLILVVNAAFHEWMKAPTRLGRRMLDRIEALRLFLEGQSELDNRSAKEQAATFERYLPYAVALDMESAWGKRFAAALEKAESSGSYSPGWYAGAGAFSAGAFASSISSSLASSVQTSSSSGSSGGGFSGGGGGGGGGGGW